MFYMMLINDFKEWMIDLKILTIMKMNMKCMQESYQILTKILENIWKTTDSLPLLDNISEKNKFQGELYKKDMINVSLQSFSYSKIVFEKHIIQMKKNINLLKELVLSEV